MSPGRTEASIEAKLTAYSHDHAGIAQELIL